MKFGTKKMITMLALFSGAMAARVKVVQSKCGKPELKVETTVILLRQETDHVIVEAGPQEDRQKHTVKIGDWNNDKFFIPLKIGDYVSVRTSANINGVKATSGSHFNNVICQVEQLDVPGVRRNPLTKIRVKRRWKNAMELNDKISMTLFPEFLIKVPVIHKFKKGDKVRIKKRSTKDPENFAYEITKVIKEPVSDTNGLKHIGALLYSMSRKDDRWEERHALECDLSRVPPPPPTEAAGAKRSRSRSSSNAKPQVKPKRRKSNAPPPPASPNHVKKIVRSSKPAANQSALEKKRKEVALEKKRKEFESDVTRWFKYKPGHIDCDGFLTNLSWDNFTKYMRDNKKTVSVDKTTFMKEAKKILGMKYRRRLSDNSHPAFKRLLRKMQQQ